MTNQVKTILLLGVLSAVLVAFGGMLGPGYLYFFTGLAVLVNLGPAARSVGSWSADAAFRMAARWHTEWNEETKRG